MVSKDLDERRLQTIIEAVRSSRRRQIILEAVNTFEVYRSDTGVILTRGVRGYEAAKDKANEIRKRFGLKWEQVKFRMEKKRGYSSSNQGSGRRYEYSARYNPSKRTHFKGGYDSKGNYYDID